MEPSKYPDPQQDPFPQGPYGMPDIQASARGTTATASGSSCRPLYYQNIQEALVHMDDIGNKNDPQPLTNQVVRAPIPAMTQPFRLPEPPASRVEGSPMNVNERQFHRILKRRVARSKLERYLGLNGKGRKPYQHLSRHNHAKRRARGPDGRFLTANDVAAIRSNEKKNRGDQVNDGSITSRQVRRGTTDRSSRD